jgi:hypothetical protein
MHPMAWPLWSRLPIAFILAAAVWFLPGDDTDEVQGIIRFVAAGLAAGLVSVSGWGAAVAPLALLAGIGAYEATDCPDRGGGGEELPQSFQFGFWVVALGAQALLALVGAAIAKTAARFISRSGEASPHVPAWLAAAVPIALAISAVGAVIARDQDTADENGPIVYDTGDVRYRAGPEWDGSGDDHGQGINESAIRVYEELPLYWLGTEFADMNLVAAIPSGDINPTAERPVAGGMTFIYGDCGPAPCGVPLQVETRAICHNPDWSDAAMGQPLPSGALLQLPGAGHFEQGRKLTIYTKDVMVSATWQLPTITVEQVLAALSSPTGSALGPPTPPPCP